jgi:formate--tetrahydrofolate ligase
MELVERRRGPRPILDLFEQVGLLENEVIPYGAFRAKVRLEALDRLRDRAPGRLVVVTGMTPTRFGEGKTTTAIGLTQGLGRIGVRTAVCLRQPSMGPLFGIKGGGTGGGMAQLYPMEEINLHFNGDFHAVAAAHNLLAASIDASLFHGNPLGLDPVTITWPRTLDVNDRALRQISIGLDGTGEIPRTTSFVITAASEVMAILALARDMRDLRIRLGRIVVGQDGNGRWISSEDIGVAGAMAVLLRDALMPNLVQTLESQPAFVHAGPFGNIAHGCNSLIADRLALRLADVVVTEAGFGTDLGLEKFCHIVCQLGDLRPTVAVLVATVRAVKDHGAAQAGQPDDAAILERGFANLQAHIDNVRAFGLRCVVAVNRFSTDTETELKQLEAMAMTGGADAVVVNEGHQTGGAGSAGLARTVDAISQLPSGFAPLNPLGTPITQQIETIATQLYGASGVEMLPMAQRDLERLASLGLDTLPVCMAKSNVSLSHDPKLKGRPTGFTVPVRQLKVSLGAGFVIAMCGDAQLMPGFGREPQYRHIDIDENGRTVGLI